MTILSYPLLANFAIYLFIFVKVDCISYYMLDNVFANFGGMTSPSYGLGFSIIWGLREKENKR